MNAALERPMNIVDARRAYQILARLARCAHSVKNAALDALDLSDDDFDSILQALQTVFMHELELCGSCGRYHRRDSRVDCRDEDERF
jgi:hypothetical protein